VAVIARQTFQAALIDHLDAISGHDIDRFACTLHRDVHLIGPMGSQIAGYDDAVAAHRGWFAEAGWTFEPTVLWSGEREGAAWALTDVRYSNGSELNRFLLFLMFVRDGESWKLIYDQNTPLSR
jgi:ketosteroid isomerase-like protein